MRRTNKHQKITTPRRMRFFELLEQRQLLAMDFGFALQLGSSGFDIGVAVATDDAGNVLVTGDFSGTVDFDRGGATANLTSAGQEDIFIAKYTPDGELLWARRIGGASPDHATDIEVDTLGNVYTVGYFIGTVDFDPGPGTVNFTSTAESVQHN